MKPLLFSCSLVALLVAGFGDPVRAMPPGEEEAPSKGTTSPKREAEGPSLLKMFKELRIELNPRKQYPLYRALLRQYAFHPHIREGILSLLPQQNELSPSVLQIAEEILAERDSSIPPVALQAILSHLEGTPINKKLVQDLARFSDQNLASSALSVFQMEEHKKKHQKVVRALMKDPEIPLAQRLHVFKSLWPLSTNSWDNWDRNKFLKKLAKDKNLPGRDRWRVACATEDKGYLEYFAADIVKDSTQPEDLRLEASRIISIDHLTWHMKHWLFKEAEKAEEAGRPDPLLITLCRRFVEESDPHQYHNNYGRKCAMENILHGAYFLPEGEPLREKTISTFAVNEIFDPEERLIMAFLLPEGHGVREQIVESSLVNPKLDAKIVLGLCQTLPADDEKRLRALHNLTTRKYLTPELLSQVFNLLPEGDKIKVQRIKNILQDRNWDKTYRLELFKKLPSPMQQEFVAEVNTKDEDFLIHNEDFLISMHEALPEDSSVRRAGLHAILLRNNLGFERLEHVLSLLPADDAEKMAYIQGYLEWHFRWITTAEDRLHHLRIFLQLPEDVQKKLSSSKSGDEEFFPDDDDDAEVMDPSSFE